MIIRTITFDDIVVIEAIHRLSQKESEKNVIYDFDLDRHAPDYFQNKWLEWLDNEDISKYCFDDNGVIKGFILYGRVKTRPSFDRGVVPKYGAEIYGLYIHPDYFRQGIGKALFRFVCKDLAEKKLTSLLLWALKKNSRACAFYDSLGGQKIAKQRIDYTEKSWAEEACYGWNDIRKI
jgi:ribosomal protein S18 acetylase RimI-like enzyme